MKKNQNDKSKWKTRMWILFSAIIGATADKGFDIILGTRIFSIEYFISIFIICIGILVFIFAGEKMYGLPRM